MVDWDGDWDYYNEQLILRNTSRYWRFIKHLLSVYIHL